MDEKKIQQNYYAEIARSYDQWHLDSCREREHAIALHFLIGMLDFLKIESLLDVGSGTGRVIHFIKACRPGIKILGIEPVKELREVGHAKGLSVEELVDGDATALKFGDQSFDMVTEVGVLHHLKEPSLAINEMLRVAKKAIFISDCNNFGTGSPLGRILKQVLNLFGLWNVADFIKTRGKGYTLSEGDGLAYSYSVYNNFSQIHQLCSYVHVLNTGNGGINPYRTSSHVALLGIKINQSL